MIDKRKNPTISDKEMYKLSPIDEFIKQERRHDELDRLNEVRQQKKVWKTTVRIAEFIVISLLILAYMGWKNNV